MYLKHSNNRHLVWVLTSFPKNLELFIEVRHRDWYELVVFEELCMFLRENKIGLTIIDTAVRRDVVHMRLTVPKCMLRFCGYDLRNDFTRLNEWLERLKTWKQAGLQEGYFFIHGDAGIESNLLVWMNGRVKEI